MSTVYLIPTFLNENALQAIPTYVTPAIQNCSVFFVENEKTARRYFKKVWKEMVIDDYKWIVIHKAEEEVISEFRKCLQENKSIGIVSEAGCPCIADPGQLLVAEAHKFNATVKPLVGPSSILLALMASGFNGQQFKFHGYLPINSIERKKKINDLENDSLNNNCTQIFIETPYRNNALIADILTNCKNNTQLSIAVDLTSENEWIKTLSVNEWKKQSINIHKKPAIFCLYSSHKIL